MKGIRGVMFAAGLCSLLGASAAFAQNTGGRTDGPEGSEIGHGGYSSASGDRFSLALNWGASVQESQPLTPTSAPLFVGVTASWWADQILVLDLQGQYLFNNSRVNVFVGPRVRTGFYPISLYLALHAGPIIIPGLGVRFGVSPEIGADLLIKRHVTLGLGYAPDLAIGGDAAFNHRIFMNVGYRF
ncbi:MAG: hypothetical protein ACJ790_16065 [Myxococcaceae bacterium]